MKRHPLGAWPLQRRQPVTHLLEARPKPMRQELDIVALGARRLEEWPIRHKQRRREIIRHRDPRERP
jgi:hypothetical protein